MSVRRGDLLPSSNSTSLPEEPHRGQQPFQGHAIGTAGSKKQIEGVKKPADGVLGSKAAAQPIKQMPDAATKHSEAKQKQAAIAGKAPERHELHLQASLGPSCTDRLTFSEFPLLVCCNPAPSAVGHQERLFGDSHHDQITLQGRGCGRKRSQRRSF